MGLLKGPDLGVIELKGRKGLAITVFERVFKEYGLPDAIRTDNGIPFASSNSLFGLSKLSVWWLRLKIAIERIRPGHPEQNGRHERMHLTLKASTTNLLPLTIYNSRKNLNLSWKNIITKGRIKGSR